MISCFKSFFSHIFILGIFLLYIHIVFFASPANSFATKSLKDSKCPFRRAQYAFGQRTAALLSSSMISPQNSNSNKNSHSPSRLNLMRSFLHSEPPDFFESFRTELDKRSKTILQSSTVTDTSPFTRSKENISTNPRDHSKIDDNTPSSSSSKLKSSLQEPSQKKSLGLEVVAIGLSHHHSSVDIREKLAIPEAQWNEAAAALTQYESISEAAVLSTCNRFEIYLSGHNQYECIRDALDFLSKRTDSSLSPSMLKENMFMLSGEDAIWHLYKVSAGLDSLIVGEGQILSQVKKAYEKGTDKDGKAGKLISRMLNSAVAAGKRVRGETGISKGAVSISSAAAEFAALQLPQDCGIQSLADAQISIIGAGKMTRLLLVHLESQGVKRIDIVNRSPENIQALQDEFPNLQISGHAMEDMWSVIETSDIVFPSTSSTDTIINPTELQLSMNNRQKSNGIQFVDISVPRNVHSECGKIDQVFCYNVDDLKAVVDKNTAKRKREMLEAEGILKQELKKFRHWQHSLGAIPTISLLQEKAEDLRKEELQKAAKKLAALSDKDLEVVERVTKGIVAKLLHGPMNHLRQQTEGDATRAAIYQVRKAFQLEI